MATAPAVLTLPPCRCEQLQPTSLTPHPHHQHPPRLLPVATPHPTPQAGALKATSKLLLAARDDGAAKAFTWLLYALTASHQSQARAAIAASPELLLRLLQMLDCSKPSAGESCGEFASLSGRVC